MTKRSNSNNGAPGASPYVQGYWAYANGQDRTPPEWNHKQLCPQWRAEWLLGYDNARQKEMAAPDGSRTAHR